MEPAWVTREYREGDKGDIIKLSQAVYGEVQDKEQSIREWEWKHKNAPAGAPIIWFAEYNGKIVGQYEIVRVKMKIGDKVITGSQSVDTMTHPEYRRQGIFETLARRTYKEAEEKGIHIVYGFPTMYSYPGFVRKLDWFDVSSIRTMVKPLNLENILKRYIPNKPLRRIIATIADFVINALYRTSKPGIVDGLTITRISSFDNRVDDLCNKIRNDYEIIVVRDKEYLNWRYVDRPEADYTIYLAEREEQILGYMVLGCRERQDLVVGYVFDIVAPLNQEKAIRCLISKAIEHFKREKADFIAIIGPKEYRKIFSKSGFISRFVPRRIRPIARVNTPEISETFIRNSKHWFLQIGDSDAV